MIPPIEEANKLGVLVFPPIPDSESVQFHARADDVLAITHFASDEVGQRRPSFIAEVRRSAGAGGVNHMAVGIIDPAAGYDDASARELISSLTSGIHSPPGTIGIRGTHSFITPEGWDAVFTGVLNDLQRPTIGVISVRVETDWLPYSTEFRYALEAGDVLSVVGSGPIGQVFFVPRTEIGVSEASASEQERFTHAQQALAEDAARSARMTRYGAPFTYQYQEARSARARVESGAHSDLLGDPE